MATNDAITDYVGKLEALARDLRDDVWRALYRENHEDWLLEEVHNAADMMLHSVTIMKMMRSILQDASQQNGPAKQLLRALEKVIEAAPPLSHVALDKMLEEEDRKATNQPAA